MLLIEQVVVSFKSIADVVPDGLAVLEGEVSTF